MQLVNCTLKLAGKHYHAINRINVSVPEYQLLLAIHGSDAIEPQSIKYAGERQLDENGRSFDEVDHLRHIYGAKPEIAKKITELFPGAVPRVATTFAEIGLHDVATPEIIEAFNDRKAREDRNEQERALARKKAAQRREAAEAAALAATAEEGELLRPPVTERKRKVADLTA